MLVEGFDEIQLAIDSGHKPQTLLSSPELVSRPLTVSAAETLTLTRPVFEKISYRENPDGWLAVFPIPQTTFESLDSVSSLTETSLIIVAESIEKPGNLGAMLRTCDTAGVDALLLCDPRVDAWNPNVVRASRGAVFSVPIVECDNASAWEWLKSRSMRIVAASPAGDEIYSNVDMSPPTAVIMGTEDEGLSDFWMERADVKVKIPMTGRVNSLNVSVSTALIVYEAVRQRGRS